MISSVVKKIATTYLIVAFASLPICFHKVNEVYPFRKININKLSEKYNIYFRYNINDDICESDNFMFFAAIFFSLFTVPDAIYEACRFFRSSMIYEKEIINNKYDPSKKTIIVDFDKTCSFDENTGECSLFKK